MQNRILIDDFLLRFLIYIEYDPNPLKSLGKRKQKTNSEHIDNSESKMDGKGFNFLQDSGIQLQTQKEKEAYK